jgi:hypothetical protein
MLLFNNYPLGGGAIHVAYSTSATAKARQQALRQVGLSVERPAASTDCLCNQNHMAADSAASSTVCPKSLAWCAAVKQLAWCTHL